MKSLRRIKKYINNLFNKLKSETHVYLHQQINLDENGHQIKRKDVLLDFSVDVFGYGLGLAIVFSIFLGCGSLLHFLGYVLGFGLLRMLFLDLLGDIREKLTR